MGKSEHIRVYCRTRPAKSHQDAIMLSEAEGVVEFNKAVVLDAGDVNNTKSHFKFKFDHVFPTSVTQGEVFDKIGVPAVQSVLDGFNGTIFAYGQTGSGKTFTITGGADSYEDRGIIPRAISLVFAEIQTRTDYTHTVHICYLEIYNNDGYDLLGAGGGGGADGTMVKLPGLRETDDGEVYVQKLSQHHCTNEEVHTLHSSLRRIVQFLAAISLPSSLAGYLPLLSTIPSLANRPRPPTARSTTRIPTHPPTNPPLHPPALHPPPSTDPPHPTRPPGGAEPALPGRHQARHRLHEDEHGLLSLALHLHRHAGGAQGTVGEANPSSVPLHHHYTTATLLELA